MIDRTKRFRVSYEVDGGLRDPEATRVTVEGADGYVYWTAPGAVIEDITPVPEFPVGTIVEREHTFEHRRVTYIKTAAGWRLVASDGSLMPSALDEESIRRGVEDPNRIFTLLHQPK